MLEQSMQTKRPSSHCHKGHKTDQPGGCNSQIQKQNQGKFLCHLIRDANSPAIFIPRRFGEWQFVIPWGSGKLKPIPRVSGSGFGEFWGVFCFRFEVNLKVLFIEEIFF